MDPAAVSMRMRDRHSPATSSPAHVVAVDHGQVAVEHDDVVAVERGLFERCRSVEHDVHGHAFAAQPARDGVRQSLFVFDQ